MNTLSLIPAFTKWLCAHSSILPAAALALAVASGHAQTPDLNLPTQTAARLLRLQAIQVLRDAPLRFDDRTHGSELRAMLSIDAMNLLHEWRISDGSHSNAPDAIRILDLWKVRYGGLFGAKPSSYEAEYVATSIASAWFLIGIGRANAKVVGAAPESTAPSNRTKTDADLQLGQALQQLSQSIAQFQDIMTVAQLAELDQLARDPRISAKSRASLREARTQLSGPLQK